MSTILKWAGNKTAIMSELKKHLPAGPRLVEPFAGSCAVMMETDYPSYLVADINPDLINLYKKVAADCESFISRARVLFEIANREVAYYNIRQEFNYSTEITDFMKAVYFLYLNRHGYRGLCRYNKSGHFNIPYGNYKNPYFPEKEIRAFAEKAQRATFICASFDETLAMLKAGEEQLRAVCLVSKKASPYVSYEAVMHKREQRRKSLEFFRSHELVNEDGDALDMEDVVNASSSNPAHRRNEMMACVKGLELIAEMRGDCVVFYTITCPSRFHSTLNNGRPNPTWTNATVRQSSDYLVGMFAAFRKAMHKAGLRWYGVRVAEPHHDGTVHWHLLCFMRKKDRRAITALLRKFAIREDREELGNNTGPRFKSELINPRKGTPTSYIAKYISKNIDGRGLAGEISKETGKSLRDNAEYVNAWASLHRVQQFRFFGIPGRQAYRELRLLAGQAARQQGDKKAGAPVLDNPRLDAILAAADAGCFATYIMKQGGVLVPRKYHLIRTAYEINEEPTAYGDHGIRIYGIWSPIAEGKICTHAVKWKMVRKAVDVQEAAADQGACAPWTRGNNCPLAENLNQQEKDKSADGDPRTDFTRMDDKELHDYLHSMNKKERRELAARLRLVKPKRRRDYKQRITDHQRQQLVYELKSRGFDGSEKEVDLLLRGGSIPSGAGLRIFYRNQRLQEDDKWRNLY